MTESSASSRRQFLASTTVAIVGGFAGCAGDSGSNGTPDGTANDQTEETDGDRDAATASATNPEEVVRQMLQASAAGDREAVRRLTVEDHSLQNVGMVEEYTIESMAHYSAREYAERAGVSVSAVEDALQQARERRDYDDATIVSYTLSTPEYDEVQRDYILVLDGEQWLMYDFGRLPE